MFIAGFITGVLAFVIARILHNRRTDDRVGTVSERTGKCKEQLERNTEAVGDIVQRQRNLISEIRKKQKLEQ